jgi:hypothetical protein
MDGCGYRGCTVDLYDVDHPQAVRIRLNGVPAFGTFSPDEKRLAIATNQGDVVVLDTVTGEIVTRTRSVAPASPTLPLAWTPDSRALLVVQDGRIEIRRATDGAQTGVMENTDGVEQLVALP